MRHIIELLFFINAVLCIFISILRALLVVIFFRLLKRGNGITMALLIENVTLAFFFVVLSVIFITSPVIRHDNLEPEWVSMIKYLIMFTALLFVFLATANIGDKNK